MSPPNKNFSWRVGYAFSGLIYTAWVVFLGLNNFDKVHGEYRRARERLVPIQIETIAIQELADQCRAKLKRRGRRKATGDKDPGVSDDTCRSFPDAVLEKRVKIVKAHLQNEEKRFLRKLVVFFISFGIFFLALPLYLFYLLLSFLVWVFRDIKIMK